MRGLPYAARVSPSRKPRSTKPGPRSCPARRWTAGLRPICAGDDRTGLGRWSNDDVTAFLKGGHNRFGSSFGTMNEVVNSSTQYLTDGDIRGDRPLSEIRSRRPAKTQDSIAIRRSSRAVPPPLRKSIYKNAVRATAAMVRGKISTSPRLPATRRSWIPTRPSLINIILNGSIPLVVSGVPDLYKMPQFRRMLNDQQVADITTFIRAGWGNNAKAVTAKDVATVRSATEFVRYKSQILTMQ